MEYDPSSDRWKVCFGEGPRERTVWIGREQMENYGPQHMTMDAGGRSRSHELIATYLEHAGSGRAWYMHVNGSAYAKRWHAKCRTSSDCAVIRHKNRADDGRCVCGEAMEDATHVYLECPLHDELRLQLDRAIHDFCKAADAENRSAKIRKKADKGDAMAWVHTDSPALISWGALSAGQALRRAALRFYAQARVDRHTAHKAHARRLTNPVPPLANEGEFPQLPRPALRRRTRRQPPGTRPPTKPSAKRAIE